MTNRLARNTRGVAVVELALIMPMLLILMMYGAEVTNYAITRQRISQLALQVADNASRIGIQGSLHNTKITEKQIKDLFIGAQLQSANLDVRTNGRIIVSQLIKDSSGQKIQWQRCYGTLAQPSRYGVQGDRPATGMGPGTTKVMASDAMPAVIFVEVSLTYKPIISAAWAPGGVANGRMIEVASLGVRDERDISENPLDHPNGIYNPEHAVPAYCT